MYDLLEHLNRERYRAFVAAPKDGEYFDKFNEYAEIIECDIKQGYLLNLRKLAEFVKEKKIDIVHSHGRGAGVYSRPLKVLCKDIKVVHSFHGIHYENKSKLVRLGIKTGELVLCKMTDMAICVSEQERKEAVRLHFATRDKSTAIYNGIDPEKYQCTIDVKEYRKQICLTEKDYVIGCVARFDKIKGHKELVEAFKIISDSVPEAKLLLIGDGDQREDITKQIGQLNISKKCILLGSREDIPQLLKCMDIFVLASHKEGLPYTPIEAMAAGIPVVITDVTGNNEIVKDGYNGLLCKSRDSKSIYQTIMKVKTNDADRNTFIYNARKMVWDLFSVKSMVEQIERVYDSWNRNRLNEYM